MTAIGQSEAEWKFWQTPELIESLLLHLDSESTLRLAQTHLFTRSIVQGNSVWKNVILQNSPMIYESNVKDLVAILGLMDDYSYNMMDLLDAICQDNPVVTQRASINYGDLVQVSCLRDHSYPHQLSCHGFFLLEKCEGAFQTCEQKVERISFNSVDKLFLSSLASRLSRQRQKLSSVYICGMEVENDEQGENAKILMQACPTLDLTLLCLNVTNIGPRGWGFLAEGFQSHVRVVDEIHTKKETLDSGRKEDIKVLWDALKWSIEVEEPGDDLESRSEVLHKYDDDAGWARLSNIMDLSLEEWLAQVDVAEDDQEVG